MSRKPGIGAVYGNKMYEYHDGYDRNYYPDQNGIKRRLPRYLRDKLYSKETRENLTVIKQPELEPKEYDEQRLEIIRTFTEKTKIRNKL